MLDIGLRNFLLYLLWVSNEQRKLGAFCIHQQRPLLPHPLIKTCVNLNDQFKKQKIILCIKIKNEHE